MKTSGLIIGTALLLIAAASVIGWASSRPEQERIVLIASDMKFYLEGQEEPNPTLVLPTDARVTIKLRNEDPGIIHDLLVKTIDDAHTAALNHSQTDRLTFRTPSKPTETSYICTFHGQTMRGPLRFE